MTAPVDAAPKLWSDRVLAIVDGALGVTSRLVSQLHTSVHEQRILREAERGSLGEPRDAAYIRAHAERLRQE